MSALAYLTDVNSTYDAPARIYNLCDSYAYQRLGYYVSLLAEARGHKPSPPARIMEDMQSPSWVQLTTKSLDSLTQHTLCAHGGNTLTWDFYFGLCPDADDEFFGQHLFDLLKVPLLRVAFEQTERRWRIRSVRALALGELDIPAIAAVKVAASRYFSKRSGSATPLNSRYKIAILHHDDDTHSPSNPLALEKFAAAAETLGMHAQVIGYADYGRLSEFDALFLRDTTNVNHYTYRFARQAVAEGLVVIDDPDSILKCNNKVYLAELLSQHAIPTPKTLVVHRGNLDQVFPLLGLPCILKQPDSAFSAGVSMVNTAAELHAEAKVLFALSDLFIAQEYLPTTFDWRVGVLDRRVLYVAKYFMAPGHWQIIKRNAPQHVQAGPTRALAVSEAPDDVIRQALCAANQIGDGFYGVDVKRKEGRCYVIEVNDNPNLDAGNEDGVLKDALYREVMGVFLKRIQARNREAV